MRTGTGLWLKYAKILIGVLLVAGISIWIYYASTSARAPTSAGTWSKKFSQYLPATNIDGDSEAPVDSGNSSAAEIRESNRILDLNQFLAVATTEEKLDQTLEIRNAWSKNELPVAYMLVWRRAKIASNLIESDVDEKTRLYAYNEYIESILTLDSLNCQGNLEMPGIREALLEIGTMFKDFPDEVIRSKASLVHVLGPAHDFLATSDLSHVKLLRKKFDEHAETILIDSKSALLFVQLLADMYAKSNYATGFRESGLAIAEKMKNSENPAVVDAGQLLKEQIFFAKIDLKSLVIRIEGGNLDTRNDVREFFQALAENPSSRIEIYQVAVDVVAQYKKLGESSEAKSLATWLGQVNEKNSVEKNRTEIAKMVAKLLG